MPRLSLPQNLLSCFLLFIFIHKSSAGICELCECTGSEAARTVNCEGRREIANYTEIFDLLTLDDYLSVEKLIVSKHGIDLLPLDAFRRHNKLKSLDLSENSFNSFEADMFKDLKSLEELNFSFNVLTSLSGSVFNTIQSLLKLNLSNNQITDLNDTTADQLPNLTHFDLSHNNLETIACSFVQSLKNLEFLDVSFNKISSLDGVNHLQSLVQLRATNNLIKIISDDFPESLRVLRVGHNAIASLGFNVSQIRWLDIEDNQIAVVEGTEEKFGKLEHLNISGNVLTSWPDVKFGQLSLLDISRNDLSSVPEALTTSNFPQLETLFIGGNPMRDLIFDKELRLRRLFVRNLYLLQTIEANAFQKLRGVNDSCIELSVTRSPRLVVIRNGALDGMNICSLDLSKNALAYISPEVLKPKGKFVAKNGINLQGNPLTCDCKSQWLLSDLVPHLYEVNPELLEDLRCDKPSELVGTRMVHWLKWKERVLCDNSPSQLSRMIKTAAVRTGGETVTLESSRGMLAAIAAAMGTLCILIIVGIVIARRMSIRRRQRNRRF